VTSPPGAGRSHNFVFCSKVSRFVPPPFAKAHRRDAILLVFGMRVGRKGETEEIGKKSNDGRRCSSRQTWIAGP
jgi:hypothetical protein